MGGGSLTPLLVGYVWRREILLLPPRFKPFNQPATARCYIDYAIPVACLQVGALSIYLDTTCEVLHDL